MRGIDSLCSTGCQDRLIGPRTLTVIGQKEKSPGFHGLLKRRHPAATLRCNYYVLDFPWTKLMESYPFWLGLAHCALGQQS